ncbi:hypothetical protein Tco_0438513 [Tanacetum coccineum]
MTTLAEFMIFAAKMGLLEWPTITQEDGTTNEKKTMPEFPPTRKAFKLIGIAKLPISFFKLTQPITEFPKIDLNLVVSVFSQVIDPIAYLNKAMAFLIVVASSRFPSTNKSQLRTSFNPRNQATIQDDKSYCTPISSEARQSYAGTRLLKKEMQHSSRGNNTGGHARVNDRTLQQKIMSQDVLLSVMNSITLNGESVNMNMQRNYFENDDLKAQPQDKYTTICKLKELIKSMIENNKEEKVNHDISKLETINEELENSVTKLLYENERLCKEINHVKQVFKDQFDLIKKTRARTKEQSDSLIAKLNLKSVENEDLKAQIQDKVLVIISLKNNLQKLKRKEIIENVAQRQTATTIVPYMFKLDLDSLAPRLLQNREAHIDYLKDTQEQADILQGIVKQAKAKQPLDNALDFACCPDCSLVYGLWMLKTYDKEPLSAHELPCALGKSKKSSHQPKAEDTNQEKLYLLHMDPCGPKHVESINKKKYILVIVEYYYSFTWVKFPRSKDEAPDDIIKSIKNIQVHLNVTVLSYFVQPMFDEYFNPPPNAISPVPVAAAARAVDLADLPMSTSIDQDAPSTSIPSTQEQDQSPIIS